jgi:hypothetical protein
VTRTIALPADVHVIAQTPFAVSASDFVKSDGRVLDQSEIVVSAQATNDGRHIKITMCVDATAGREKASPGQYIGAINFDDPRIDADAIPGIVTLKYVSPLLMLLLTLVVGAFALVWAVDVTPMQESRFGLRGSIAAAASVLAIVPSVFVAQYVSNPAWGDSIGQLITYIVAAGAVVIATYPTLLRLINTHAPQATQARPNPDGSPDTPERRST